MQKAGPFLGIVTIGHAACLFLYVIAIIGLMILPESGGWNRWWLFGPGHYAMLSGFIVAIIGWVVAFAHAIVT